MFGVGDLVWTKARGFPRWPGIVMDPGENSGTEPKKPSKWVFNFGSKDWYWVNVNNIELYDPTNVVLSKRLPAGYREKYKEGCKAIRHVHKWGNQSHFYPRDDDEESEDSSEEFESHKRLSEDVDDRRVKKSKPADSTSGHILKVSPYLVEKNVEPSDLRFGFLGLSEMGCALVKNLLHSKHNVTIFDSDLNKMKPFLAIGAKSAECPQDVVNISDITFSCFLEMSNAKDMLLGHRGGLLGIDGTKSYVELSPMDIKTSEIFSDLIRRQGGSYLEAQIYGDVGEAEDGVVLILSGGDRELYQRCQSCFRAFAKCSYYLGAVGSGCKMIHCLHLLSGVCIVGLFEALQLGDAMGLDIPSIMEVMKVSKLEIRRIMKEFEQMKSDRRIEIGKHIRQLSLVQNSSNALSVSIPLSATANEVLKHSLVHTLDSS